MNEKASKHAQYRYFILGLIAILISLSEINISIAKTAPPPFHVNNEAINPACVALFNHSLGDRTISTSINLDHCQHSNAAYQQNHGNLYYENDKDRTEGWYQYNIAGITKNGIYVIETKFSGGGSGVFNQILLIKLSTQKQFTCEGGGGVPTTCHLKPYTAMTLLGEIPGGDRCTGGFQQITVKNNTIHVAQYAGERPVDGCGTVKKMTVNAGQLQ